MEQYNTLGGVNGSLDNLLEGFQMISFDWRYLYINDAVLKQSKFPSKEDLLGYTMMEKYPGIEKSDMFKVLQHCMDNRVSAELENEFTFPDQTKGWFELRIEPVPDGLFILSIDITKRKLAEADTSKYINGLEEMLFITSHRVRQPVANILGVSNLLDMELSTLADLSKIVGYMKQSAISLDLFTRELTCFMSELKAQDKSGAA